MRVWSWAICALCAACAGTLGAGVEMTQDIHLVRGWNALRVEVTDTNDVNRLFAAWPVDWVALYDPAAFLETRQYSAEASGEGTTRGGYLMWRRDAPGISGFARVPADSVLVCFAKADYSAKFCGEPCAPRITWHKSGITENLNLVGFSTWDKTNLDRYFSGLDIGNADFFVFGGDDTTKPAVTKTTIAGETDFADAQVLAISSSKVSDWSGVLNVSPRNGLDFGTEGQRATLEVRNDGAEARLVQVKLVHGDTPLAVQISGLYVRDALTALTNGEWRAFSLSESLDKELEAGETWELQFALDRRNLQGHEGDVVGSLLDISDISESGSRMRVNVPVKVTNAGNAAAAKAWPMGVWLAVAELDQVSFFLTKEGDSTEKRGEEGLKAAGGKMKVRLPLYVDEKGAMTLMQRFWYGRNTNGVLRAFSGAVTKSDEPLYDVKRVSSACLPADQPVIGKTGENVFGRDKARFQFTVNEWSNVNPMRHAQHPQHDGLTADYLDVTPSGDNLANYMETVKPEAFSVTNLIEFTWDPHSATAWNPEETLTGDIKWDFGGLRHERTVQATGRFAMKRLSPVEMK